MTKTKVIDSCIAVILALLGLVAMYLNGEMALTSNKKTGQEIIYPVI